MKEATNGRAYNYHICSQQLADDGLEWIFTIQKSKTLYREKIPASSLAMNLELLSQFHPQDIFTIAYTVAERQILYERMGICNNKN